MKMRQFRESCPAMGLVQAQLPGPRSKPIWSEVPQNERIGFVVQLVVNATWVVGFWVARPSIVLCGVNYFAYIYKNK